MVLLWLPASPWTLQVAAWEVRVLGLGLFQSFSALSRNQVEQPNCLLFQDPSLFNTVP